MTSDWGFQRRMIEEFDGRGAWEQMPEMTEIEFLEARITEDEAVAGQENPWHGDDAPGIGAEWAEGAERWDSQPHGRKCGWRLGEQISDECECGYPARVLAECEAKRAIIATYEGAVREADRLSGSSLSSLLRWTVSGLRDAVHILATVYRDHPDWDPDWDGVWP